jgi:hypothetical protein
MKLGEEYYKINIKNWEITHFQEFSSITTYVA